MLVNVCTTDLMLDFIPEDQHLIKSTLWGGGGKCSKREYSLYVCENVNNYGQPFKK